MVVCVIEGPQRTVVHVDNKQCLVFAKGTCVHTKTGGVIDKKTAWVEELRDRGKVEIRWVRTQLNIADMFTKCLDGTKFAGRLKNIQTDVFNNDTRV